MRLCSVLFAAPLVAAFGLLVAACRGDQCFLKICEGKKCRCSISSCGEGAAFDTKQNRCRCLKGYFTIAGQCMTQEEANTYCGVGHHWEGVGCAADRCKPGDELDVSVGLCIPKERVNQVASNIGVQVGAGQKLGCPAGTKLVIDGPQAACIPISQTCARDETWTGQACAKVGQCPAGSVWDTARAQCVQYAQGGNTLTVNVGQWAISNYGPNGGMGTTAFCSSFAQRPWDFGVVEGATAMVRVNVMLSFPESEIAKGVVQTTSVFDASGNPIPAKGSADVDAAAKGILKPLTQGGGRASAPTASTMVKCAIISGGKPAAVPATGGF
jgi:hypothetical protein